MHDPDGVRGREPAEHFVDLRRDFRQRSCPAARDQIGHRTALGELHRVPGHVAPAVPVVDRHDGWMRELRGESCLAPEPAHGAFVARDVGMQELQRDLTAERLVPHAPHGAETAGTERGDDLVIVGEGPAETNLRRLARGRHALATQREHGAAADHAIHGADHRRHGGIPLSRLGLEGLVEYHRHGRRYVGPHEREGRDVVTWRGLAGERREAERGKLPLIARGRGQPAVVPLRRQRHPRGVGRESLRHAREWHRPLPSDEPEPPHRRREHVAGGDRTVDAARVVQIRQGRAYFAQHAQRGGHIVRTRAGEPGTERLSRDPATEIPGSAMRIGVGRPVVIGGRHCGVVTMRERSRLGLDPAGMILMRRAHERERAPERVDELLKMPMVLPHPLRTPVPVRRQLP